MIKVLFQILFIVLFASSLLQASDTNTSHFFNYDKNSSIQTIKENLPDATNSTNNKNWNMQDWNNYFKKNGLSNTTPTNTQLLFQNSTGKEGLTGNVNKINNNAIYHNDKFKNINSLSKGWTDSFQNNIMSKSTSNSYISVKNRADKIDCYITRDLSFSWKCSETGVTYGGDINSNGKEARLECESQCYHQNICANMVSNSDIGQNSVQVNNSLTCKEDSNCSLDINLDPNRVVENISLKIDTNTTKSFVFKIDGYTSNGSYKILDASNAFLTYDNNTTINVEKALLKINLSIVKTNATEDPIIVKNIVVNYRPDNKFICVALQDIKNMPKTNFAHVCPSGNIITFHTNGRDFQICADSGIHGDNPDGTFSDRESCEAICRIPQKCESATFKKGHFNTNLLHTFREGCIAGQANCTDQKCKDARLLGYTIVNESIFDASQHRYITIQNSIQNHNVDRPRVLPTLNADTDFTTEAEQEWKDKAFANMAKNGTYTVTVDAIGEDSIGSSAYSIYTRDGADIGIPGVSTRVLYWLLKPSRNQVFNDVHYYLYSIIKVTAGYIGYDGFANRLRLRKEIWYIKTALGDHFKPVRYAEDYEQVNVDDNNNTYIERTGYSSLEAKTFSLNNWIPFDASQTADSFDSLSFDETKYYWKIPIIENMGNILYNLPGLVRYKTYDQYRNPTNHYDGKFDGSGDGILGYKVYTIYSSTPLTYQEIFNKIDNNEIKPIYALGQGNLYSREVKADSLPEQKNIKIYQYGPANKTSVTTIINPEKKDIGQKGFIFVFIQ